MGIRFFRFVTNHAFDRRTDALQYMQRRKTSKSRPTGKVTSTDRVLL